MYQKGERELTGRKLLNGEELNFVEMFCDF